MASFKQLLSSAFAFTLATTTLAQTCGNCQSFGVDFVNGGSYFQNISSTSPFTAVQEFEGCSDDVSDNVLVDPSGNQYECSTTPLQPDDTPELITCPINKNQLTSGDWSLIVISNNGNCNPIAFERDFSLSVGVPSTITVSANLPAITISTVVTPIVNSIITTSTVVTSSANPTTTTVPRFNFNPTITIQPLPAITVVTKALVTLTSTSQVPQIVATSTNQATATCQLPSRRVVADNPAKILPTILGNLAQQIFQDLGLAKREAQPLPTGRSATSEFKRAIMEGRAVAPEVKAEYLAARHERLALNKRAPDDATTTTTVASGVSTTTVTSTAPATTVTGTTTVVSTTTVTPIVTVSAGVAALSVAKVTAAQRTITNTLFVPATVVYETTTTAVTLTVTSTITPAALVASCSGVGGVVA